MSANVGPREQVAESRQTGGPSSVTSRPPGSHRASQSGMGASSAPQQQPGHAARHPVQNVVDLSLIPDEDDDDEIEITLMTVAPKRRRLTSPAAAEAGQGAKPAAARGISLPSEAVKNAIEAAAQQMPPSPEKGIKCAICLETIEQMASTACGHVYCYGCILLVANKDGKCPKCRSKITKAKIHRIYLD